MHPKGRSSVYFAAWLERKPALRAKTLRGSAPPREILFVAARRSYTIALPSGEMGLRQCPGGGADVAPCCCFSCIFSARLAARNELQPGDSCALFCLMHLC